MYSFVVIPDSTMRGMLCKQWFSGANFGLCREVFASAAIIVDIRCLFLQSCERLTLKRAFAIGFGTLRYCTRYVAQSSTLFLEAKCEHASLALGTVLT